MVVALLTDFGTQDYFVAAMKGVILSINPDAKIIDVTHEIPPQDIASAAFVLKACYRDFPRDTIFVCVVDPGVGSERRAIVVETEDYKFVAPDNGLLDPVLLKSDSFKAFSITNRKYMRSEVSNTFHGRDIFAPAAGHLSTGVDAAEFGGQINLTVKNIPTPVTINGQRDARVIHIDHFGNLVTDISNNELPDRFELEMSATTVSNLYDFFAQADLGELFAIKGSSGYVEIAVREGSAADKLKVKRGDRIVVRPHE